MENDELDKYKKLVSEISDLKKKIERYLYTKSDDVEGMTYAQALKKLSHLRALQRMTPKKIRERYVEFKEL